MSKPVLIEYELSVVVPLERNFDDAQRDVVAMRKRARLEPWCIDMLGVHSMLIVKALDDADAKQRIQTVMNGCRLEMVVRNAKPRVEA
jgi:hypothetical protein